MSLPYPKRELNAMSAVHIARAAVSADAPVELVNDSSLGTVKIPADFRAEDHYGKFTAGWEVEFYAADELIKFKFADEVMRTADLYGVAEIEKYFEDDARYAALKAGWSERVGANLGAKAAPASLYDVDAAGLIDLVKFYALTPKFGWADMSSGYGPKEVFYTLDQQRANRGIKLDYYHARLSTIMYAMKLPYSAVKHDDSLNDPPTGYTVGVEVEGRVHQNVGSALASLSKMLAFISAHGKTTITCGLHFSVKNKAYDRRYEDVNSLKLSLLLGEKGMLKAYGREGNEHVLERIPALAKGVKDHGLLDELKAIVAGINTNRQGTVEKLEDLFYPFSFGKHSSWRARDSGDPEQEYDPEQDYDADDSDGSYELRIIGNAGYEGKWPSIKKDIDRYIYAMVAAEDVAYEKTTYEAMLFRLAHDIIAQAT